MIVPLVLSQLLAACAPRIGSRTMGAIVAYESGARPFAIGDNTSRRAYFPDDRRTAAQLAKRLLQAGHDIDVGYAQVNSGNFARLGLDAESALEPCTNLRAGASILQSDYAGAVRSYGAGQTALFHALSAYNTGGYRAGLGYARGVFATAETLRYAVTERPAGRVRAVPFRRARLLPIADAR